MNTVADYFSLQETRFVLEKSKNSGVRALTAIAAFDLLMTAVIWYLCMVVTYVVWNQIMGKPIELGAVLERDVGLAFFLSTFFTSAAWWLYLLSVVAIRIVMRHWYAFGFLLDTIAESGAPARMTVAILSLLAGALYGISIGVIWIVQSTI